MTDKIESYAQIDLNLEIQFFFVSIDFEKKKKNLNPLQSLNSPTLESLRILLASMENRKKMY